MKQTTSIDTIVVGGGIIGMSVAYGLARAGQRVTVLDQGDDVFRAARGNFGLVWVQGKGLNHLEYARWSLASAQRWAAFATELVERTGIDLELSQIGGLRLALTEEALARSVDDMGRIRDTIGMPYPFERLDRAALRERLPHVGPDVVGALYSSMDGHVSPLRLLRSLLVAFKALAGVVRTGEGAEAIEHRGGEFQVRTRTGCHVAGRIVLAAGLGNKALAPHVGLAAPVHPERGQIIVTERVTPFLRYPTSHVRQTGEGVVQLGDSKEATGYDDGTTTSELGRIARNAARQFPLLDGVNVMRAWGALRVMTPDGYPIYQASQACPGAFLVTCHSGITLAANHAGVIADWIRGADTPPAILTFKADRFHVQTASR
ncbi:NAD(P)/FAD-dependent oxidoreductase [Burkholderia sp. 22PA0106]|uniref:NAD(P)/FAD-dependent oxidoreductase n=1 Tax=Burkholderia sp. 22PA0106 TaxID=3237371 RepID=UPI0039C30027